VTPGDALPPGRGGAAYDPRCRPEPWPASRRTLLTRPGLPARAQVLDGGEASSVQSVARMFRLLCPETIASPPGVHSAPTP
jgi:hypothetical protein